MAALLLSVNFFACEKTDLNDNKMQHKEKVMLSDLVIGEYVEFQLVLTNNHVFFYYGHVTYFYDTDTGLYIEYAEIIIVDLYTGIQYNLSAHRDDNGILQTSITDENGSPVTGELADEMINGLYQYLENNLQQNQ